MLSFLSSPRPSCARSHCYIPVAANGVGCDILHSADGGVTWAGTTTEPFALLLLDIAATNANVVALGALSLEYSLDNAPTFNSSLVPFGAGQCIRSVGAPGSAPGGMNSFAAVGDWGFLSESNGPAISTDNGAAFSAENITSLTADARYGAFPSAKTWYIAAGDWPGEGSDDSATTTTPTTPGAGARRPLFKRPGSAVNPAHYAPGVAPGSTSAAIVSNIDIGATILDLAGAPPAGTPTDGRSFAAELRGGAPPARDRTVIEYGRWGTSYFTRGPCAEGCGVCSRADADLNMLMDGPSDVYSGLRIINATHNLAYAEFSADAKRTPGSSPTSRCSRPTRR